MRGVTRRKNRPDDNIGMRRRLNPGRKQTDGNTVRNNRKITDWAGLTVTMTRRCKRILRQGRQRHTDTSDGRQVVKESSRPV